MSRGRSTIRVSTHDWKAGPLIDRVRALAVSDFTNDLQKALHLVDFVLFNDGDMMDEARTLKADLLEARSKQERSFVAHNPPPPCSKGSAGQLSD